MRRSIRRDLQARADRACDAFAAAWVAGKSPRIEFYMQRVAPADQPVYLQALLQRERDLRLNDGESPSRDDYLDRFADNLAVVESVFREPDLTGNVRILPRSPDAADGPDTSAASGINDSQLGNLPSDQRAPDNSWPESLGRYRILRKLGEGAMGIVFLAEDEELGRSVALKIPHGDQQSNSEARVRFQREGRAAAALHHPSICPIYDVGESDGIPFICMGYIEGTSLSHYAVSESGLNEKQITLLVSRMAKAMQHAHDAGIVHRDIKPANVMISRKGVPIIMDFGLARRFDISDVRVTETGVTLGSPAYMSPEQVTGEPDAIGPASDIHSLGVVLFELLTGRLPFEGSVGQVIHQILTQPPPRPSEFRSNVSPHLEQVCLQMLARSPTDRPASMADVVQRLNTCRRLAALTDTGTAAGSMTAPSFDGHTAPDPPSPHPILQRPSNPSPGNRVRGRGIAWVWWLLLLAAAISVGLLLSAYLRLRVRTELAEARTVSVPRVRVEPAVNPRDIGNHPEEIAPSDSERNSDGPAIPPRPPEYQRPEFEMD